MFWLRGALVAISVFVIVYASVSVLAGRCWKSVARIAGDSADILFALRMFPVLSAVVIVFGLAIPSFWRYEPRLAQEAMGPVPLAMLAAFLVLSVTGLVRAWSAVRQTDRCVERWARSAECDRTPGTLVIDAHDAPPVALAGVRNSRLLISTAAQSALTPAEMERAIAHEQAHRRSRDNFKKLLLQACAFPGMAALNRAWLGAIELSADAQAVRSHIEAVDLASALVKIARLHDGSELPALASGFVDGPPASLEARVQRLLHWNQPTDTRRRLPLLYASVLACAAILACNYVAVLQGVHAATELLVR